MTIIGVILGWFAGGLWFVSGLLLIWWSALAAVRSDLAVSSLVVGLVSMILGVLVAAAPVRPMLAVSAVLSAVVGGVPTVLAAVRPDPLLWLVCIGCAGAAAFSAAGHAATRPRTLIAKSAATRAGAAR